MISTMNIEIVVEHDREMTEADRSSLYLKMKAAPEMYEALKIALDYALEHEPIEPMSTEIIERAVARAEGRE